MTDSKVLIDSWAWIEYWRGGPGSKDAAVFIEGKEEAYVSTINIAEVYRWFLAFYDDVAAEEAIQTIRERCHRVSVSTDIAVDAAKTRHRKKWGLGDSLIFATAEHVDARIVTGDPDFREEDRTIFLGNKS
ncbi:MAG: type II toxin-antitoxin system VapC family toxin [Thermoplasmata archaeon]|nr:type II toxin-antitoxin system VapC family toxin [Thermoplasmata archaeon]